VGHDCLRNDTVLLLLLCRFMLCSLYMCSLYSRVWTACADLFEAIEWMRANDASVQEMVRNANEVAPLLCHGGGAGALLGGAPGQYSTRAMENPEALTAPKVCQGVRRWCRRAGRMRRPPRRASSQGTAPALTSVLRGRRRGVDVAGLECCRGCGGASGGVRWSPYPAHAEWSYARISHRTRLGGGVRHDS